ncbi:MAG: NADH-quinone oxidoreductase subunit J [Armatimonadetes bacterium]|nr:NADH-quinone oxidoreductase subunit J [Armatimonadota bacterium]
MTAGSAVVFLLLAALAIGGAWRMITSHHPVHSALYLVITFCATAGLYLMLGAPFIATVQVAVYAGAIMVLFLFVVMYLNLGLARDVADDRPRRVTALATTVLLGLLLIAAGAFGGGPATAAPAMTTVEEIGGALFSRYALPFEIASLALLVAMIGVLVIARPELKRELAAKEDAAS